MRERGKGLFRDLRGGGKLSGAEGFDNEVGGSSSSLRKVHNVCGTVTRPAQVSSAVGRLALSLRIQRGSSGM